VDSQLGQFEIYNLKFENEQKITMTEYNLEKRTLDFSAKLIGFLKTCSKDQLTMALLTQCLRSGTSIGANYREANGASSRKDFLNKLYICKKEAKETLYWLELIGKTLNSETLTNQCDRYGWNQKNLY